MFVIMSPSQFYVKFRCKDTIIGFLILCRVESKKALIRSSEYINICINMCIFISINQVIYILFNGVIGLCIVSCYLNCIVHKYAWG